MNLLNRFLSKEHDHLYRFSRKLSWRAILHYSAILLIYTLTGGLSITILERGVARGFLETAITAPIFLLSIVTTKLAERCIIRKRIKFVKCLGFVTNSLGFLYMLVFQLAAVIEIEDTFNDNDHKSRYHASFFQDIIVTLMNNIYPLWIIKWLQIVASCIIQIKVFDGKTSNPQALIIGGLSIIFVSLLFYYKEDRFSKQNFLEKYRLDQEAVSLKAIIGDLCEGVLIYNPRENKSLYHNRSLSELDFWSSDQSLLENLNKLQITRTSELRSKASDEEYLQMKKIKLYRTTSAREFDSETNTLGEFFQKTTENTKIDAHRPHYLIDVKFRAKTSQSSTKEYSYQIQLLSSGYGGEDAWAFIIRDTTERDTVIRLQGNNEYKSRLLASVSHELRTPLNASITFTEKAMEHSEIPDEIKNNYLKPSLSSSKLLLNLINDILDFSQMKANKLRLVFEEKNIVETVRECVDLLALQAEKKGIFLNMVGWEDITETLFKTDHNRVRQIILNLLSNALKFTYEGGITIKLQGQIRIVKNLVSSEDEERKIIKIVVEDTGIGIKREDQKKLFKDFEKIDLDDRKSMNASGVGLGLVISNDLARSLGPTDRKKPIEMISEFGVGTTFEFEIMDQNLRVDQSESNHQKFKNNIAFFGSFGSSRAFDEGDLQINIRNYTFVKASNETDRFETKRNYLQILSERDSLTKSQISAPDCSCPAILIVDDDMFNIAALETLLHSQQLTSVSAFNGKIAIEKYLRREKTKCGPNCRPFGLIFMDCNMPVMDGYEAARTLKTMMEKEEIRQCSIIGCTAFIQPAEVEKCREYGMDECASKPLEPTVLIQLLKRYAVL